MKLLSYRYDCKPHIGILQGAYVYEIPGFSSMNDWILDGCRRQAGSCWHPLSEVELLAPIPHPMQDVICLGLNYREHAEESARAAMPSCDSDQEYAAYFSKRVDEAVPPGGVIDGHFDIVDDLDYEVELAVILSRDAYHVKKEDALSYVLGYTILNDVSARTIQRRHHQWFFGKSLKGFTPMGPWIVTADEIPGLPALDISCRVNGEVRQHSNTRQMIFGVDDVIAELSGGMLLKAGTILSMGTPSGVAMGMSSPRYLKDGDIVECDIEGIGRLTNVVRDTRAAQTTGQKSADRRKKSIG